MGPVNMWASRLLKRPCNTQNSNKNKQQTGGGWGWEKKGANLVEEHREPPGVTALQVCGEGSRAGSHSATSVRGRQRGRELATSSVYRLPGHLQPSPPLPLAARGNSIQGAAGSCSGNFMALEKTGLLILHLQRPTRPFRHKRSLH